MIVIINYSNKTDIFPPGVIFSSTENIVRPQNMDGITSYKIMSKVKLYQMLNINNQNINNLPDIVIYPRIYCSDVKELNHLKAINPSIIIGEDIKIANGMPIDLRVNFKLYKNTLVDNCFYNSPWMKCNDRVKIITETFITEGWKSSTTRIKGVLFAKKTLTPTDRAENIVRHMVKKSIADYLLEQIDIPTTNNQA